MSTTEKIDELKGSVMNLEVALQQLQNDVNRLLCAHGEKVPIQADALPLKCQCHEK